MSTTPRIVTLKNWFLNRIWYPKTVTKAVWHKKADGTDVRLDNHIGEIENGISTLNTDLTNLGNVVNTMSRLKASHVGAWNIDDLSNYPSTTYTMDYSCFAVGSTGTRPFSDGHLLTFVWRTTDSPILSQIAIEDDTFAIKVRKYSSGAWASWRSVDILS